jgi:ATP-dependent Clp protease ATP-binding subunit ClpX
VTFRHGDFDENTFYCAACSGWFVIKPENTIMGRNGNRAGTLLDQPPQTKKAPPSEDPQILMQHIPEEAKIYASRQRARDASESSEERSRGAEREEEEHPRAAPKRMPTPREIMRGLNEYVIGQRNVKVALSVGVYNHYKRIFVSESQAEQRRQVAEAGGEDMGFFPVGGGTNPDVTSLTDLNLGQFGSAEISKEEGKPGYCEAPDINSITDCDFARDVEDCEIEKSNIMLLGPTGSGKTLLVRINGAAIDLWIFASYDVCLTRLS